MKEIHLKNLTPRVPPFQVTQGGVADPMDIFQWVTTPPPHTISAFPCYVFE